jgi:hypothetical protein
LSSSDFLPLFEIGAAERLSIAQPPFNPQGAISKKKLAWAKREF